MSQIKCGNYYNSAIFFSHSVGVSESIQPGLINLCQCKFNFDSAHVKYDLRSGPILVWRGTYYGVGETKKSKAQFQHAMT